MARWTPCLAAVAVLLPGCLPVTEPLSDPEKAEPENRLLGKWEQLDGTRCQIDCPEVKGNPKGLMRCRRPSNGDFWFFTATIGKHTYWNVLSDADWDQFPDFGQERAFERWNKPGSRLYHVLHCVVEADRFTVRWWGSRAQDKLGAEQIPLVQIPLVEGESRRKLPGYFKTPPGWLAKYLEKNGPESVFDGPQPPWLRPEVAEKERPAWEKERRAREEAWIKAGNDAERGREADLNEAYAGELVEYARYLIYRGDRAGARRCLERTTRNCGDTGAAGEAKELLKKLNK
jgi:hypothetical protein